MTNVTIEENIQSTPVNQTNFNTKEVTEDNCKFKDGDTLKLVRVRFPGHAKSYPFLIGKRTLMYGQKVMAMSDRGMALGYINSFTYEAKFKKNMLPLRYINKLATEEDIKEEKQVYKRQKDAETLCQRLIEKHKLDMNLTHVEFTGFGKKVVFYFISPARVDFRNLVKDLVSELRLRIELRQISLRDRAASMGALGPCGRELCCSSFLSKYGNASIKMAKNQNLTLNYSKLNGACGQLKCCLQYEDEVYEQKRKYLPDEGSFIETKNGDKGRVFRLNILSEQFDIMTEKGKIKRFVAEQFKAYLPKSFSMPRTFPHVSDETSTIIGLNDLELRTQDYLENEQIKQYNEAIDYAHEQFTTHSETETIKKEYNTKYKEDLTSDSITPPTITKRHQSSESNQPKRNNTNNSSNSRRKSETHNKRSESNKKNDHGKRHDNKKPGQKKHNANKNSMKNTKSEQKTKDEDKSSKNKTK